MGIELAQWWPLGRWGVALVLASYMSVSGLKKKSLNRSGAMAAFFVGLVSLGLSLRLGLTLILFYKSSSILTKVAFETSSTSTVSPRCFTAAPETYGVTMSESVPANVSPPMREHNHDGGHRVQHVPPCSPRIDWPYVAPPLPPLSCYPCRSSELGVLSKTPPRLITKPWKTVPPGTNGGMSPMGTVASVAAGVVMGAGFLCFGWAFRLSPPSPAGHSSPSSSSSSSQLPLVLLGGVSGLAGSILDSLMGAVLQASYFDTKRKVIVEKPSASAIASGDLKRISGRDILTNEQVNVVSV
ncbi:unnamed protein product, partial [Ectocarpus sp. 8 AP-2014]